ncbi:MAG: flagellar motor protein MotB [Sandaracinus sp.]
MAGKPDKGGKAKVIFIKKKGGGHAHHGGAWKVAYADFVTAMMALFMVLWLVSQTDEVTRSQLARYFRSGVFSGSGHVIGDSVPSGRGPTVGGGATQINGQHGAQPQSLEATAQTLQQVLDLVAADDPRLAALREQIDVRLDDSGLLIQISDGGDEILFGLASSELTPSLEEFLAALGPVLGRLENELQIHGHTDARPFPAGSTYDNWDLSFARADAARRFLEGHGVRPHQIVGVQAHADSDLLVPEDPLDPRNRRLSILAVRPGAERPAARGRAAVEGDPESAAAQAAQAALDELRMAAEIEAWRDADARARGQIEGGSAEGGLGSEQGAQEPMEGPGDSTSPRLEPGTSELGSPELGSPGLGSPGLGSPGLGSPEHGSPEHGSPEHGSPELGSPEHGSPGLGSPGLGSPEHGSPEHGSPERSARGEHT